MADSLSLSRRDSPVDFLSPDRLKAAVSLLQESGLLLREAEGSAGVLEALVVELVLALRGERPLAA